MKGDFEQPTGPMPLWAPVPSIDAHLIVNLKQRPWILATLVLRTLLSNAQAARCGLP